MDPINVNDNTNPAPVDGATNDQASAPAPTDPVSPVDPAAPVDPPVEAPAPAPQVDPTPNVVTPAESPEGGANEPDISVSAPISDAPVADDSGAAQPVDAPTEPSAPDANQSMGSF